MINLKKPIGTIDSGGKDLAKVWETALMRNVDTDMASISTPGTFLSNPTCRQCWKNYKYSDYKRFRAVGGATTFQQGR